MRIERLDIYHVAMPLIEPWRTAYGEDPAIEAVLVRAVGDSGIEAWGESSPLGHPTYSPETAGGAAMVLARSMAQVVIGQDFEDADALNRRLNIFRGNPFAKAALETAFWGLLCVRDGEPLHRKIGGQPGTVSAGEDFGICDSIDQLLARVGRAVEAGFERVKLKIRPGWDLEVVRQVRNAFEDLTFHVDCNGGYSLDDLDLFKEMDGYGLAMFEQPLAWDDLLDHAELAQHVQTPICLDESIKSPRWAEQAVRLGAAGILNLKPGRLGGIANVVAVHDLCGREGLGCWIGGMLESGVGAGICVELASLPHISYPADIFPSSKFYVTDLARRAIEPEEPGVFRTADGPWVDNAPDPDRLAELTVMKFEVQA